VLNERGELAGLVIADYAEGMNRVLALPAEEIARAITEAGTALTNLYSWGDPLEGYRVTAVKNLVTIDWSAVTLPEKAEGEQLYVVVADIGNDYLNFYPAERTNRTIQMTLAPGRIYLSGILACSGSPSEIPEHYEVTVIPEGQRLTEYGFTPTLTAVAEMPEDAKEGEAPVPVTEVTEELLRSGRAWFYSASRYKVTEKIPDKTLLVTLTDPEGNVYRYESSWIYAPEYMNDDVWYISLAGLRGEHPVFTEGTCKDLFPEDDQVYAYIRETESEKAVVLINLSTKEASYDAACLEGAELLTCTHGTNTPGVLRPLEAAVYLAR
jgi:hypothetical protein